MGSTRRYRIRKHKLRDRIFLLEFDTQYALAATFLRFQEHYEQLAEPFEWRFTRYDLLALLDRLEARELALPLAA